MVFACVLLGCTSKQTPTAPVSEQLLVVQVKDFSRSIKIDHFDTSCSRCLYYTLARTGGVIKVIGAYSNSQLQNVFTIHVPKLDTQSTQGITNIYQVARIKSVNQQKIAAFGQFAQQQIAAYTNYLSQPCTSAYTDLTGSLVLASTTLNEPVYATGYHKVLLLCTDMINDPQGKRNAALKPVELTNTTVLAIRPSLTMEKLQGIFPNSPLYTFTTTSNAITFLNQ